MFIAEHIVTTPLCSVAGSEENVAVVTDIPSFPDAGDACPAEAALN